MNQRLTEIDIIRNIVIVFVVLYHCFAPYCGGWTMAEGLSDNKLYWWVGKAVYCGMLESFVCISGYVYAFTSNRRQITIGGLIKNKTKRLLVPCVFWSIVFILILSSNINWGKFTTYYSLFNGVGHLWFLPMLFWCFILEYILNKIIKRPYIGLIIVFVVAILPYPTLPLRFNNSLYYLFFFNLGYVLFSYREQIIQIVNKLRYWYIIFPAAIYVALFILITNLLQKPYFDISIATSLLEKAGIATIHRVLRLGLSVMVFAIYYLVALKVSKLISEKMFNIVYFISVHSFGIYLLQEIVIRLFYYKTAVSVTFGVFTPWIVFVLAFVISTLVSYVLRRNIITRNLC